MCSLIKSRVRLFIFMSFNEKDLNEKFLTKCKELALDTKFEPVPPRLEEHWVTIMWLKGVISALNWAGYEVRKKDGNTIKL